MKQETSMLEHPNFFNKIINEENNVLILLSSLPKSCDHITITMLYENENLIVEEVTTTLLSNEIRKRSNQDEQEGQILWPREVEEEEEEEEDPSLSKACHFYHMEGHGRRLQALARIVEEEGASCKTNIAMSGINTKVLMASYVEDNSSQGKN